MSTEESAPPAAKSNDENRDDAPPQGGLSRRGWLGAAGGIAAAAVAIPALERIATAAEDPNWKIMNGRIQQSVCHWCFEPMPLEELARAAAAMGIKSVEIVPPETWPTLKKHGLICAMTPSHGFVRGLNNKIYHAECIEKLTAAIEATSAAGFPNVITFSGMREGLSDEVGIQNTIDALKQVLPLAEKKKVNLCLEPLNTRVDVEMKGHPGYQCDKVEWAVEVCEKLGSPRMKILFDIYHTQVMQGDVIVRINKYKDLIGHYHTAGVPGRNDIGEMQEINYPPIMRAIVATGYKGYVGQEYIPSGADKLAALRHGVQLCDV
ncbi:MAG TPA: TIM barrel protein [Pirellulales bacterium]|jgi:hydroxypyruvate isomerase